MNGKIVRRVEDVEPDAEPVLAGQGMTKTMAPRIIVGPQRDRYRGTATKVVAVVRCMALRARGGTSYGRID